MQSSSFSSFFLNVKRSQMDQSKAKLNDILLKLHRPSPFGKSRPLQVDERPLLILIDADSVSEDLIIQWLAQMISTALRLEGWICANRKLSVVQAWIEQQAHQSYLQTYQVPLGQNEADHFLIAQSLSALKQNQHCAAIIYTLDRDLFKITDAWRLAGKAVFISPLRVEDESAQNLIKRCQELGINLITPQLDLI